MKQYKLQPYVLGLRTTEKCNVGCYHCSISAIPNGSDMPLSMGLMAIEEAASLGIKLLHLSGGEPLLYENLVQFAEKGHQCGMEVEIVTSTYTSKGIKNHNILEKLAKNGLRTVMISYDDAHARKVDEKQFVAFLRKSFELGLFVCVFVTEGIHTTLNTKEIKEICIKHDVDADKIEWSTAIYQYFGRGMSKQDEKNSRDFEYFKCPYVMPVPTLRPNGDVLMCPCSVLDSKNFILGNVRKNSIKQIFNNMLNNKIYRNLAENGQQKAIEKLGIPQQKIPFDMCQACELYLKATEIPEQLEKINSNNNELFVDYEALLTPHKNFIDKYY